MARMSRIQGSTGLAWQVAQGADALALGAGPDVGGEGLEQPGMV